MEEATPGQPRQRYNLRNHSVSTQPDGQGSNIEQRQATNAHQHQQNSTIQANPAAAAREWQPSLSIGDSLGEGLSAIETADRQVEQWRAILDYRRRHFPDSVAPVEAALHEAIRDRGLIQDTPENRTPVNQLASTQRDLVSSRLDALRSTLTESTFPPEADNIRAAIAGYESETITVTTDYTLIWAGRIVDVCPSYTSFTDDRQERLDRYHQQYGPGWLWWEPPLLPDEDGLSGADALGFKSVCLVNPHRNLGKPGYYKVCMGFRRVISAVHRDGAARRRSRISPSEDVLAMSAESYGNNASARRRDTKRSHKRTASSTSSDSSTSVSTSDSLSTTRPPRVLVPDPTFPPAFFTCLLDSGATNPFLYRSDLSLIHITPTTYAAQGILSIHSLTGLSTVKYYDMEVGVYASDHSTLAEPSTWPAEPPLLGMLQPVNMLRHAPSPDHKPGAFDFNRLSGILPFHVAYVASAPGMGCLYLGGERADVLGAQRMPGQLRRGVEAGHPREVWAGLGNPRRVVFEHERGDGSVVRDEDVVGRRGASVTTVVKGGRVERRWKVEPRRQVRQARAMEGRRRKGEKG